ncbi:hypothetical protein NPX13_g1646 [Xylaria arbuscula]|uniref:Clr5 domain-containing protein n=1 Tax=Xylaria arbuscula TaxID=114810 RepID=A0A9W8NLY8_9PEZI|nr:hypothetical protein NPX13_g1646 [Xylaria arbuscula]
MASDDWEQHKVRIVLMYCLEKKSLQQIVSYMKEHHNFNKKSNQYEYRLRTWGIRKNATKDVWSYVAHRVQKRKKIDKRSKVLLYGVPVPDERLRKEIQRYTIIPTATDFGIQVASPQAPGKDIVHIRSPSVTSFESMWPETLPWFQFEQRFRIMLRMSSSSLIALVGAFKLKTRGKIYQKERGLWSLFPITGDISMLRQSISDYSKLVPRSDQEINQKPEAPARVKNFGSMATSFLEAILFRLSNNISLCPGGASSSDLLAVQIVEGLSRSYPQIVSSLLSDCSETANAIKEELYKSAIRQKNYAIISRLLECGVDPDLSIQVVVGEYSRFSLQRGKIQLHFRGWTNETRGIELAAMTTDTRLGKMLLGAGANANLLGHDTWRPPEGQNWSPLGLIGLHSGYRANFDDALEFAYMLIEQGATVNPSIPPRREAMMSSPLDVAIARHDNLLVELIIRQGGNKTLYAYAKEELKDAGWFSPQLRPLGVRASPLLVAIVSGNNEVTEQLLQPILLQQAQFPRNFFEDIFVASCLAGDAAVTSRLLLSLDLDLNEYWADGITPLVATAWNPDLTIARLLLAAGANIGPERRTDGRHYTTQITVPTPIHVAAFHGNAELVRMLIDRGASCNVTILRDKPKGIYFPEDGRYTWLLPLGISSPLHLALKSEDVETISLLLPNSELIGGELVQAIRLGNQRIISELLCRGADVLSTDKDGKAVLDSAVEKCDAEIISLFFASGGKYKSSALYQAIKVAIESGDNSLIKVLLGYRSAGPIDNHEASCLVLALEESEWDLVYELLSSFTSGPSPSFYRPSIELANGESRDTNSSFHVYDTNAKDAGITPLWAAYLSGHVPIVEKMLQQGYSLQASDEISFSLSVMEYNDDRSDSIMKLLLSTNQPAKMSLAGRQMLLFCAIKSYNVDEARMREYIKLVDSLNFALHPHFDLMRSPLGWAIVLDKSSLVSTLIDAGASAGYVNYEEINLESALSLAAYRGNVEIAKLLIDREANGNGPPSHATAALTSAALSGHLTILKILIDHGADMNSLSGSFISRTALESAAMSGRLDVIQLFIERGVNVGGKVRIHYIRSILFARSNGHYVVANLLTNYGSWTQKDQMIYDRPSTGDHFGIFQYDEQLRDWHHRREDIYRDRLYRIYSQPTVSSAEPGTCDSSSGEEEEADKTSVGALTLQHEMDQETDEWLRTVSDTFGDPAGFNIGHEDESSSPIALPLRPGNRVTTEPNSPQQPSDGYGETETEELAGTNAEGEKSGQQDNIDSEPTARERERSVIRD